jgi:hypothetical protein
MLSFGLGNMAAVQQQLAIPPVQKLQPVGNYFIGGTSYKDAQTSIESIQLRSFFKKKDLIANGINIGKQVKYNNNATMTYSSYFNEDYDEINNQYHTKTPTFDVEIDQTKHWKYENSPSFLKDEVKIQRYLFNTMPYNEQHIYAYSFKIQNNETFSYYSKNTDATFRFFYSARIIFLIIDNYFIKQTLTFNDLGGHEGRPLSDKIFYNYTDLGLKPVGTLLFLRTYFTKDTNTFRNRVVGDEILEKNTFIPWAKEQNPRNRGFTQITSGPVKTIWRFGEAKQI